MEVNKDISSKLGCNNDETAGTGHVPSSSEQSKNNTPQKTDFFRSLSMYEPPKIHLVVEDQVDNTVAEETTKLPSNQVTEEAIELPSKTVTEEAIKLPTNQEEPIQENLLAKPDVQSDLNDKKVEEAERLGKDVEMHDQGAGKNSKQEDENGERVSNVTFRYQDKTGLYDEQGQPIKVITGDFILFQGSSLNMQNEEEEAPQGLAQRKSRWINATSYFVDTQRVRKNKINVIDLHQVILQAYEVTRIAPRHADSFLEDELKSFKSQAKRFREKLESKLKLQNVDNFNKGFYSGAFLDISYCQQVLENKIQLSERDYSLLLNKRQSCKQGNQFQSDLHKANAFIHLDEVIMHRVEQQSLIDLVDLMYQNLFDLYPVKSQVTLIPHLVRDQTKQYDDFMIQLGDVCDAMLPCGAKTLEQVLRCIMAQLFESCKRRYEITEFLSLWKEYKKARLNDTQFQAVVKLAALVVGIPFTNKCGRLAWFNVWSSMLFTWNVSRGFSADTKIRRTLEIKERLSFSQVDLHTTNQIHTIVNQNVWSTDSGLQKLGYTVLTQFNTQKRDHYAQLMSQFKNLLEEFWRTFTRPNYSKGHQLNFFLVAQKVPKVDDSALDFVLVNVLTTEMYRLRIEKKRLNKLSVCVVDYLLKDLSERANVWKGQDSQLIDSILSYSQILFGQNSGVLHNSLPLMMEYLVVKWKSMFESNPTLFIACTFEMISNLLQQKTLLDQEMNALLGCKCIDEKFENARAKFIEQLQCCLIQTPYYLDVALRRVLIRYFAEIWLHRDYLITLFKDPLSGKNEGINNLTVDDFSNDLKPRPQAIQYQKQLASTPKTPQDYLTRANELLKIVNAKCPDYAKAMSILLYCLDPQNGPTDPSPVLKQILSLKDVEYGNKVIGLRLEWFALKANAEFKNLKSHQLPRLQDKCIKIYVKSNYTTYEQLYELAETNFPLC